jgi:imidazolonepropionase-like amidohydrolase
MRSTDVGSLETGAWADMLVLSDDPTKDLSVLENPSLVVKGGQVVHRSQSATTLPTPAPSGGR